MSVDAVLNKMGKELGKVADSGLGLLLVMVWK
jgi:hypothetical protein